MATTEVTPTYLFPYPTGEDSLSNVAQRIQDLAERIETTYGLMGIDTSFTNLMQSGDAAGGSLTGTYPNPLIATNAISNSMLQDNSVNTAEIVDGAVTTSKIATNVNLNGNPTTTTQNITDNSTRIATTSFVNTVAANLLLDPVILPAGSVQSYMLANQEYINFNTLSTATLLEGGLVWNDTEGVLMMGIKGNPVPLYLGEQIMDRVTNVQGSTINALSAVRVFGSSGNRLTVKLAQANTEANSTATFGITVSSIADNQSGYTISQGLIKEVDTSGLTEGAAVWLSPSVAGGLTTTKPAAPDNLVLLGFCVRSHANNGILLVKIVNGFELDELHDVQITSVANNDLLQYSTTNNTWKNVASVAADKITGTAVTQADTGTVTSTMIADNTIVSGDISTTYPGHLVVANTAARPASPTIGQVIFQSDTGEFLKWVTDIDGTNRWMQVHTAYTPNRNMLHNALMQVNQRTLGPIQVTNKALTTNVVTLTTATNHGLRNGATIIVSIGDPVFDGIVTITSTPLNNTFTYARTATNVTAVATSGWVSAVIPTISSATVGGGVPYKIYNGYSVTDRWKSTINTLGTYMHEVVRDAPANTMLRNSFKTVVTTISTSIPSTQECRISQTIEGQNAQVIRKGTANALPTVLSFWVKSNVPGTYITELTDTQNVRQISKSYTINAANTWEKKVITIPADTTGILFNDNTAGLELSFWLGAGATYTSGTLNSTNWAATTNANRAVGQTNLAGNATSVATTGASGTGGATGIATLTVASHSFVAGDHITVAGVTPAGYNGTYVVSSVTPTTISYYNTTTGAQTVAGTITGSYFQLTGVQFEIGTAPSELEVLRYEDDLLRCQRYCVRITNMVGSAHDYLTGLSINTTTNLGVFHFPVTMRVPPSELEVSGSGATNAGDFIVSNGAGTTQTCTSVPTFSRAGVKTATITSTVGAVLTAGQAGNQGFASVSGAFIGFNADF